MPLVFEGAAFLAFFWLYFLAGYGMSWVCKADKRVPKTLYFLDEKMLK